MGQGRYQSRMPANYNSNQYGSNLQSKHGKDKIPSP